MTKKVVRGMSEVNAAAWEYRERNAALVLSSVSENGYPLASGYGASSCIPAFYPLADGEDKHTGTGP